MSDEQVKTGPDIVERLRTCESLTRGPLYSLAIEAWDEIERLRAENERLRALIIEWDDAERAYFDTPLLRPGRAQAALTRATLARIALRRAVGR